MKTLKQNEVSPSIFFTGVQHILVIGNGEVQFEKSLDGKKTWYPLTDSSGEIVHFSPKGEEHVLFNSELENQCQQVHYRLKCLDGELQYMVTK